MDTNDIFYLFLSPQYGYLEAVIGEAKAGIIQIQAIGEKAEFKASLYLTIYACSIR